MHKTALLGALLFVSGTASAADTNKGTQTAAMPAKELEQLKFFDGEWKCDGKMEASEQGPAHTFKSTVSIKPESNNMWYGINYTEEKSKDHPARTGRGYWGYDPSSKQFVRMFVGSNGDWETATSQGWTGNELVWTGTLHNFMGQPKTEFKHSFTKKGNNEFTDKFETNNQGTWKTMPGSCTCKKQTVRS
jgi:hypothetical protein